MPALIQKPLNREKPQVAQFFTKLSTRENEALREQNKTKNRINLQLLSNPEITSGLFKAMAR